MISTHRIAGLGRHPVPTDDGDRAPVSGPASLERLRTCSRELEGGILFIHAGGSACLLDLARRRFGRARPGADRDPHVVGRWHSYDQVFCDGDDLVIVPSAGAVRIRIRPTRAGRTRPTACE